VLIDPSDYIRVKLKPGVKLDPAKVYPLSALARKLVDESHNSIYR